MRFIFLALLLLISSLSFAQIINIKNDNALKSKMDSVIHKHAIAYLAEKNTIGLSIGIILNNKKFSYNYGETKKCNNTLPSSDNFYGTGSIDKTFAALLLANAVIDGKLNLDDDIRKYLPGEYLTLTFNDVPITFENLANHTSGLPNAIKVYPKYLQDSVAKLDFVNQVEFYSNYNRDSLLKDLQQIKLDTIPGTRYNYNNNDIKILILLLEFIYKKSYDRILTDYLNKNFSMYNTKVILSEEEIKKTVTGYFRNEPQKFINLKGFYVGYPVISTINDMLKYLDANLNGESDAIKLTHQLTWGDENGFGIGLGWMIDYDTIGDKYIYHSGNTRLGYNSMCLFYPGLKLGMIVFVNDTNDLKKVGNIVSGIKNDIIDFL